MLLQNVRKPSLSWPYLLYGWGEICVVDLRTGLRTVHLPGYWPCGWYDSGTVYVTRDGDARLFSLTPDGTLTDLGYHAPDSVAANGGWGYTVEHGRSVWNGRTLSDTHGNRGFAVNGPWALHSRNEGTEPWPCYLYASGSLARRIEPMCPDHWHEITPAGDVLYGGAHGQVCVSTPEGEYDSSATTNRKELRVKVRAGYEWSVCGQDATHILNRSLGLLWRSSRGITDFDICDSPQGWLCVVHDDVGVGETFILDPAQAQAVAIPFEFQEEVPVLPHVGRHVACFVYFRDSKDYGDRPATPGGSIIVDEPRALPAENYPDEHGEPVPMMLGLPCLLHDQLDWWWDRVQYGYVVAEGDVPKLRTLSHLARYIMGWRGLEPRELVSYTAGLVPEPNVEWPTEITGVQWYPEPHETPETFAARMHTTMQKVAGRRVAAIPAFYDRNGTLPHVERFVPTYRDLLAAWPNVELVMAFNDGRQNAELGMGGMRYHPELYAWWSALINACR